MGFVLIVLLAGAVVVAVSLGQSDVQRDGNPDPDPPATAAERQADAVARAFTTFVRDRDATRACGLATARLARELRCSTQPRLPRTTYRAGIPRRGPIAPTFDADPERGTGRIRIAIPGAINGPITTFSVTSEGRIASLGAYGFI